MWTTGVTHMIARLTGSTLFANHHLTSFFGFDHCSFSTTNEYTPSNDSEKNLNTISNIRDFRVGTPYTHFVKDNYADFRAKYPELKMIEISKKLSAIWHNLSDTEKNIYIKRYQEQKANYEEKRKQLSPIDLQILDTEEKARKIEHHVMKSIKPIIKRPRSAFSHFLSSLDRGAAPMGDFIKGAFQRWSQMPAQDKQRFKESFEEEREKYYKALLSWSSSMSQNSNPTTRRSRSLTSTETDEDEVKQQSESEKRTVKRTGGLSKSAIAATKSTRKKSSQKKDTKSELSSSSSDDDSPSTRKKETSSKQS